MKPVTTLKKLRVHWMPIHVRAEPLRFFGKMKPPTVKIIDPDVQHVSEAYVDKPKGDT